MEKKHNRKYLRPLPKEKKRKGKQEKRHITIDRRLNSKAVKLESYFVIEGIAFELRIADFQHYAKDIRWTERQAKKLVAGKASALFKRNGLSGYWNKYQLQAEYSGKDGWIVFPARERNKARERSIINPKPLSRLFTYQEKQSGYSIDLRPEELSHEKD